MLGDERGSRDGVASRLRCVDGREAIFLGIIGYVLLAAWLSRHIALDMDARGKAGWAYGIATFALPPLGIALWLLDRNRPVVRRQWRPELGSVGDVVLFLALLFTFPWGLLIWLFLNRRASPQD